MDLQGQAAMDYAAFTAPDPAVLEKKRKEQEKQRPKQQQQRKPQKLTAAQMKAAQDVTDKMSEMAEMRERASLVRKIRKYVEKFPDRIDTKVPRTISVKAKLSDLIQLKQDIEADLGMSGGTEMAIAGYSSALKGLEVANVQLGWFRFLDLRNLSEGVDGTREQWQPLIEEFVIKHEEWFSMRVEYRIIAFTAQLVMKVHQANMVGRMMYNGKQVPAQVTEEYQDL